MALGAPVAFAIGYAIYSSAIERAAERHRLAAPCAHGIAGAAADRAKCSTCTAEYWQAEANRNAAIAREEADGERKRLAALDEWKAKLRLPTYLRAMHPQAFESLVCGMYERLGWDVRPTPYVGDGGIDAVVSRDQQTFLVQCKRVKSKVGEPVVRDLYGAIAKEGATGGIIVTTGAVSSQARAWAKDLPIRFVEMDELLDLVRKAYDEAEVIPEGIQASDDALPVCPSCGRSLRNIKGRFGTFLGCTGYPTCKYKRNLARRGRR